MKYKIIKGQFLQIVGVDNSYVGEYCENIKEILDDADRAGIKKSDIINIQTMIKVLEV